MKTALWESSPGALAALLNSMRGSGAIGTFTRAHLYTINLAGGGILTFTDADLDISVPFDLYGAGDLYDLEDLYSQTWLSNGVRVDVGNSRATGHWKRGLDVDSWTVVLAPRLVDPITLEEFPDKIGDVPWIQAAQQGVLDGAQVFVERAYFAGWPQPWTQKVTPVGVLRMFAGEPAEIDVNDTTVAITIRDYRQRLQTQTPTGMFQAGCRHTLFDVGCTLSAASFVRAGTCIGGSTKAILKSALAAPGGSGTYTRGRVVMTSGLNSGFQRTVREWALGSFSLLNPFPFDVAAGDTFNAYPGCDKSQATCTVFANIANFGGESFIPSVETAA